jgi:hypothetical protein
MPQFRSTIRRIAFSLLLLSTGLSAQRYTGHDHAVFHRQPQSPPAAAKHQSLSGNTSASHPKTTTTATAAASTQQDIHAGTATGKLVDGSNHSSAPAKTDPPLENAPHL